MGGWWWTGSKEGEQNESPTNDIAPSDAQSPSLHTSIDSNPNPSPSPSATTSRPRPSQYVNPNSPFRILEAQSRERDSHTPTGHLDKLNRDEDAALAELSAAFSEDHITIRANTSTPPSPTDLARAQEAYALQREKEQDSLYPSTMSCSQCFDAAYLCSSMAGQMTNLYRYGALRSCSDLWAQWRFCMRTKTMSSEESRRRIREWNREKEARRRVLRGSEKVWEIRNEGPPEGALGLMDHDGHGYGHGEGSGSANGNAVGA